MLICALVTIGVLLMFLGYQLNALSQAMLEDLSEQMMANGSVMFLMSYIGVAALLEYLGVTQILGPAVLGSALLASYALRSRIQAFLRCRDPDVEVGFLSYKHAFIAALTCGVLYFALSAIAITFSS